MPSRSLHSGGREILNNITKESYVVPGVIPAIERTEAGMREGGPWDEAELAGLSRGSRKSSPRQHLTQELKSAREEAVQITGQRAFQEDDSTSKGPEAAGCLARPRDSKEASAAGVIEGQRRR